MAESVCLLLSLITYPDQEISQSVLGHSVYSARCLRYLRWNPNPDKSMGTVKWVEHDTYRVGMLVLRLAGHGLIISLVIYDLVDSPVCGIKQVLKGQTHGDGAYGCAVGSPHSKQTVRRQPPWCYTPPSLYDLLYYGELLWGVSQFGIEVSWEIQFPFLLFSNTGAKCARLCWAICLWEFCSIDDSEFVLWFGWLAGIETTNIQKLFKNMCDLVCTIWTVQQEPCF